MADGTSSGHNAPEPEQPAAHHDHLPSTHHAGPEPAANPSPPQSSGPHHKHHSQNGALDDNEGPSGGVDQQQYTYGSFNDVERQEQQGQLLPAPQPQDLWPLFFALVVLACFLIFLIVPLVSPS